MHYADIGKPMSVAGGWEIHIDGDPETFRTVFSNGAHQ